MREVFDPAEIVPIILISKIVRIKKGEEVERALPLKIIQRVNLDKREER